MSSRLIHDTCILNSHCSPRWSPHSLSLSCLDHGEIKILLQDAEQSQKMLFPESLTSGQITSMVPASRLGRGKESETKNSVVEMNNTLMQYFKTPTIMQKIHNGQIPQF
jgi:hypothetical protein